jgi:uncharacterized protein YdeI (YjbR/CyaY-like superfamily)
MAADDHARVHAETRVEWRRWLAANHGSAAGAWLVSWKKPTGKPAVGYDAAVEEALCFGWIDSQHRTIDDERSRLLFTPRRAKSGWSASNVARVERLLAAGLMEPAGLSAVEDAKARGAWP